MLNFSKTLFFALLAIIIAYWYSKWNAEKSVRNEMNVIDYWNQHIKLPDRSFTKVAVGINACVDLIVSGSELLKSLSIEPSETVENHLQLQTLKHLQETFSFSLSTGAAIERPFTNEQLFRQVIDAASGLEKTFWYIGGNAALIAQKIVSLSDNAQVQLVGPVGPRLKNLLHQRIHVPVYSISSEDEVHLIMEYKSQQKWGPHTASCANRFITSHDVSNSHMTLIDAFFKSVDEFKPDLVVLSGIHMLESQPKSVWLERMDLLSRHLSVIPQNTALHLELASMANHDLMQESLEKVIPHVTSLGFNEQELKFMSNIGNGPHTSLKTTEGILAIDRITDSMLWLLKTYGHSDILPESRLTRLHFHSLTFHVIATVSAKWTNSESAVASGTRMAGLQACDLQTLDPYKVKLKIPEKFDMHNNRKDFIFNVTNPVYSWTNGIYEFVFSPVLVCKHPIKTVGLGDAISATGLLYSQYINS
ncbi:ADP-dependent glucokinase-like [Tubulanus polymorphus]|uniref:ADP-dependent glucokinase-like n=1 Tax=Tubulanus polymorphus TaxID=672921 RepID=UPI003DA5C82D